MALKDVEEEDKLSSDLGGAGKGSFIANTPHAGDRFDYIKIKRLYKYGSWAELIAAPSFLTTTDMIEKDSSSDSGVIVSCTDYPGDSKCDPGNNLDTEKYSSPIEGENDFSKILENIFNDWNPSMDSLHLYTHPVSTTSERVNSTCGQSSLQLPSNHLESLLPYYKSTSYTDLVAFPEFDTDFTPTENQFDSYPNKSSAITGVAQNEYPVVIDIPVRPRLSETAFKVPALITSELIWSETYMVINHISTIPTGSYSTKVFLGGLPHDTKAHEIKAFFSIFGEIKHVEWPDSVNHPTYPPNGFAFVVFKDERSVHHLLYYTKEDDITHALYVWFKSKSETKPIEIRPWKCEEATFINRKHQFCKIKNLCEVFIGGIPRSFTAAQLCNMLEEHLKLTAFSVVIDVDSVHRYPKGTAKVTFGDTTDALKAISISKISVRIGNQLKHMEVKTYRKSGFIHTWG